MNLDNTGTTTALKFHISDICNTCRVLFYCCIVFHCFDSVSWPSGHSASESLAVNSYKFAFWVISPKLKVPQVIVQLNRTQKFNLFID